MFMSAEVWGLNVVKTATIYAFVNPNLFAYTES